MPIRTQAALQSRRQENLTNPLRDYTRIQIGRIIDRYPEHGLVDVALERGTILRKLQMVGNGTTTRTGSSGLPQVHNSPRVKQLPSQIDGIYDEQLRSGKLDSLAIVAFPDGYHNRPLVLGTIAPNSHQQSFSDPTLNISRELTDTHELHWSDEGIDLRPVPYGGASEEHPDELLFGNYQLVFADRQKDYPVEYKGAGKGRTKSYQLDPKKEFGNDHQTYISVGYHDKPRVFGDGNSSANYDHKDHPWKLSTYQKGDKDEDQNGLPKGQKHARGIVINQRWRSRFAIDNLGNVTIRAEGLDYDSTEYEEKEKSYGTLNLWSRLEARTWHKHLGTWVRMRPRFDGKGKEDIDTAKKTGTLQYRVQRLLDVAVRKDAEFRVKDGFTLKLGDFDSQWNDGDLGKDPGTKWDDETDPRDKPVLNRDFRDKLSQDEQWKGSDYLDAGNFTIDQKRGEKAKATGPQTSQWTIEPTKSATDAEWHLDLIPSDGNVLEQHRLIPGTGKSGDAELIILGQNSAATLTLHIDSSSGAISAVLTQGAGTASVTLETFEGGGAGTEFGVAELAATGPHPCSVTCDASTGVIQHLGTDLQFNHSHSDLI